MKEGRKRWDKFLHHFKIPAHVLASSMTFLSL